jgi:RNA polymerase sigma-70 factor (ECF subfamily)
MDDTELRRQLEACHRRSYGWALHCCGRDRSEADDVLQTAYLKVLDGRARFDGRSSFVTWLFGVIRRTALDERRKRIVRFVRHAPLSDDMALGVGGTEAGGGRESSGEGSAPRAMLERSLNGLSRRQREVVLLVFYHERTVEEAAAVLGIGVGSARTHYTRGKERLRELLAQWEVKDEA